MAVSNPTGNFTQHPNIYDLDDLVRLANPHSNKDQVTKSILTHGNDSIDSALSLVGAVDLLGSRFNENEIQSGDHQHFLDCFYILSADVLAVPSAYDTNSLSYNSVQAKKARRAVAEFILRRIDASKNKKALEQIEKCSEMPEGVLSKQENDASKMEQSEVSLSNHLKNKCFLAALSTFCTGIPALERTDRDAVIRSLKNISNYPNGIIYSSVGKSGSTVKEVAVESAKNSSADTKIGKPESSSSSAIPVLTAPFTNSNTTRPQTDLTSLLFGQLCSPMEELLETPVNINWPSVIPPPIPASSIQVSSSGRHLHVVSNIIHPNQEQQIPALNLTTKSEQSSLMPSPFEPNELEGLRIEDYRHSSFVNKNTALLHGLKAGDVVIDFCSRLPELSKFISQWNDATVDEVKCVPTTIAEAQLLRESFKGLLNDIDLTSKALSLPILEPLTTTRLTRLTKIVMGCLIASLSVATAQSIYDLAETNILSQHTGQPNIRKISSQSSGGSVTGITATTTHLRNECQLEGYAEEIVEKSLELFNTILATVRQSTRAGGHTLQNYIMMGAWVLVKGLLVQIESTSSISDKVKRTDAEEVTKAKQGFSVLSVALGSQALTLTSMLVEDLSSEITELDEGNTTEKIESANLFDLFHPFMATQRVALILQSVPFIQLLFRVAMISYSKAGDFMKTYALNKDLDPNSEPEISKRVNNSFSVTPANSSKPVPNSIIARKPPARKSAKSTKDQIDRCRNRRGVRGIRSVQRRVIEDESTGDEDDDEDDEDSDEDDTDDNELAQNRTEPSDDSDNEDEEENNGEDEDDDSEPLLGKWFEETLFPPEEESNAEGKMGIEEEKMNFSLTNKGNQPSGFISLASHIFIFLNKHILASESQFVRECITSGLGEAQMFVIADIVQDLDCENYTKETYVRCCCNKGNGVRCNIHQKDKINNNGSKTKSTNTGTLSSLYAEFSSTLATFAHNLLAYGLLTPKLQNSLLARLSVSPWVEFFSEVENESQYLMKQDTIEWPLRVNSRTLALLAQVLLLRQNSLDGENNAGREATGGSLYPPVIRQTNTYVVIWEKVLSKLTKCIIDEKISKEDSSGEDLNIEHAQLLLFIFHALGLMQKKQVLIYAGNCLIKVAGVVKSESLNGSDKPKQLRTNQIFHASRLILLFEYIMTHLYEPTKQLLEQVQSNIFKKQISSFATPFNLKYHGFTKIEDNFARYGENDEFNTPRFYNLFSPSNDGGLGHQSLEEGPIAPNKLDGLACSFVLGTPDALQYGQLYQSLIDILHVVHQINPAWEDKGMKTTGLPADGSSKNEEMKKFDHLAAIQYCFSLTWRLLQSMPPSVEYLEHIVATKEMPEKIRSGSDSSVTIESMRESNGKKETFEHLDTCSMLHSLLILPRVEQKVFGTWVKDCLVKQGQTMAKAEELVKKSKTFNTFAYDVGCMKHLLQSLISKENSREKTRTFVSAKRSTLLPLDELPRFFDLLVLDATMAKVQISLDRMFSGVDSSSGKSATASTREQVAASAVERLLGVTEQLADAVDAAHDLVPLILQLVEAFSVCAKSLVLHSACLDNHYAEEHLNTVDDEETVVEREISKTDSNSKVEQQPNEDGNQHEEILNPLMLKCLAVSGNRCQHTIDISQRFNSFFPASLRSSITTWNDTSLLGFPPVSSWRSSNQTENYSSADVGSNQQASPFESYISSVVHTHILTLSFSPPGLFSPPQLLTSYHAKSLKHCLYSAARFAGDLFVWYPESSHLQNDLVWVLFPLILDGCAENLSDLVSLTLERLIGVHDSDEFLAKVYQHVLANLYSGILTDQGSLFSTNKKSNYTEKKILHEVLRFMESMLDKPIGRHTLDAFFSESPEHNLVQVLLSIAPPVLTTITNENEGIISSPSQVHAPSSAYTSQVLSFFNKLFVSAEKYPDEPATKRLCTSLAKLSDVPQNELENWLRYLVSGIYQQQKQAKTLEEKALLQENIQLLQALTNYIVSDNNPVPEEVALTILNCLLGKNIGSELLLPTSEGMPFSDLMAVLTTLANAESGVGHVQLFRACTEWMATCRNYIVQKNVIEKLEKGTEISHDYSSGNGNITLIHRPGHTVMVENACNLLSYMSDVVFALKYSTAEETKGAADASESAGNESDVTSVLPYDWMDDGGFKDEIGICGEDSGAEDEGIAGVPGEDSDDEGSNLDNRLCTYAQTQKEFTNQHWYHCHTCRMVDSVGVCAICAKVCHAGHDVTYSKHGSFFCDCGAKEDNSCIALVKRTPGALGSNVGEANTSYGILAIAPRRQDSERSQSVNMPSSIATLNHPELSENTPSALPASVANVGMYDQENVSGNLRRILAATGSFNLQGTTIENNTDIVKQRQKLAKKLGGWKDVLSDEIAYSGVAANLLELLRNLMPVIKRNSDKRSSNGRLAKLQDALAQLHASDQAKTCEPSEHLILPTLGSQEGAFENVRMNYSGDQGQTIRQLVTTHAVRRVVMCCLASSPSSSSGKRQHLAVAHEKGKITVLQLSALLKQADSSQKKLTLTRLASAPVPFTVLSIVPNPCNEDYLAVAGIKDCHILTFNGTNAGGNGTGSGRPGEVTAHLVLHPQLDANNYIIKTVWMPGSQTELALVTADFIKIYSLGEDALSPQYYFLVPSGKVRDCTLAFMKDGSKYVLIMSSAGHIYFQQLTQESSAGNGPFYVTNIMDVSHPAVKDYSNFSSYETSSRGQVNNGNNRNESQSQHCSSEQIGGGGVSIYYSQSLQCLFFSYVKGKNFMAPLSTISEEIDTVFPIQMKPCTTSGAAYGSSSLPTSAASTSTSNVGPGNSGNSNKNAPSPNTISSSSQPLCQWGEIQGHPGLITAFLQSSNNPVVIMVRPDRLQVQEIKVGSKAKIVDMVAIRHNTSGSYSCSEQRTTLILLCEDGSLKIYMAALGESGTEFWLPPIAHPMASIIQQKPPRKVKKAPKRTGRELERQSSQFTGLLPTFSTDYFENCSIITDVEFSGADVLQVYNVQQIKHRLQTTSLYIANTKPTGFELEISNLDANQVIVGIRVMLGSQDTSRVPSYIELFGRRLPIGVGGIDGRSNLTRGRWFELPLTREESLAVGGATIGVSGNDKQKLIITLGPSLDPGSVNIVDSVQIYGKTKEIFGWPEDSEEAYSGIGSNTIGTNMGSTSVPGIASNSLNSQIGDSNIHPFSPTDRIVTGALEILDGCFAIQAAGSSDESLVKHKSKALELTSQIITISTQTRLEVCCKALLAALFQSPASYYNHKDQTLLRHVAITFKAFESGETEIDIDTFQRLILITRGKYI